jgi:single-strand DNA-binding protein
MASFNKVILVGNISNELELKQTQGGLSVCSFYIAVNRRFAKEGEQACDFINIVTWRQQAEFVARYFKKGSPILVCGSLQVRSWTDNQGNKRYATDVVADEVSFVGNKEGNTEPKPQPYMPTAYTSNNQNFEEIPNEEGLPF